MEKSTSGESVDSGEGRCFCREESASVDLIPAASGHRSTGARKAMAQEKSNEEGGSAEVRCEDALAGDTTGLLHVAHSTPDHVVHDGAKP